ncbi:transposase [Paraglaciecola sp. 20A4]|uniref:REP-associated tyrosine transposase n=1 Tax=Paraglaciecola sp. 20A4 TaxID=2687288 RepID=UPI00140BF0B7|nr:transposase [Paraglaciecola sp. 20A4]
MSRPLRLEYAGALYHVTSRGNERNPIYRDEADFDMYLDVLTQACERFNWIIHAYCLMTNHYHLLVETPDGNLSKGMRHLNGVYTQKFNRKHKRVGHLYQGRYKSILVDKDTYLLELSRYIVLNPVRAKNMVEHPQQWKWSSYLYTTGELNSPNWLATNALLLLFSKKKKYAIKKYQEFVMQGLGIDIWDNLQSQIYLGSHEFVEKHKLALSEDIQLLSEIPHKQTRRKAKPMLEIYKKNVNNKKQGMIEAYVTGGYTMSEIGSVFGVHYSTVSRVVAKFKT